MAMDDYIDLPPGFRFHPTDEEIITHYLSPKAANPNFSAAAIGEVDLNKCEPWDLPSKAKMGEKEWYFFCQRDRKYPTGMRTNRATAAGYWKATGKDKEIFMPGRRRVLIGMKKTLVFYTGRAPKGDKTNWVMHEYRLHLGSPLLSNIPNPIKDEWGVCRVFHKNNGAAKKSTFPVSAYGDLMDSPSLPPLMDCSRPGSSDYCFNNIFDESFDFKEMNATSSYLSSLAGVVDNDFSVMTGQIPPQNPYSAAGASYLHQDYQAGLRKCKVEQLPSHSFVSGDTDRNTDISSVVSRHDAYDDLASGELDLDDMWKC